MFQVKWSLLQRLWVPFAPRNGEKITAVDVDGCGDLIKRVRDCVDDRFAEWNRFFAVKRFSAVLTWPVSLR